MVRCHEALWSIVAFLRTGQKKRPCIHALQKHPALRLTV